MCCRIPLVLASYLCQTGSCDGLHVCVMQTSSQIYSTTAPRTLQFFHHPVRLGSRLAIRSLAIQATIYSVLNENSHFLRRRSRLAYE